jgi:hypothetical protein
MNLYAAIEALRRQIREIDKAITTFEKLAEKRLHEHWETKEPGDSIPQKAVKASEQTKPRLPGPDESDRTSGESS